MVGRYGTTRSQALSIVIVLAMSVILALPRAADYFGESNASTMSQAANLESLVNETTKERYSALETKIPVKQAAIGASSGSTGVSFAQPAGSPIGVRSKPFSAAAGDFNLDGRLDLAVANSGEDDVTILLGDGTGRFTQGSRSPVAVGSIPLSVAVGDFNLDGKPDLAVANAGSDSVTILLGDGSGGFTQPAGSPVSVGIEPFSVVVGDFNLDGKPDLAVANDGSPGNVTILLGNGSGGFTQPVGSPVTAGHGPIFVTVGDFNLDGRPDLAVANNGSNDVTILLGDGSGGFTQPAGSPISAGTNPISAVVGDFNLDGKPDLAVANFNSSNVTILLGNGSGGFIQPASSPVAVGSNPRSIAMGDFNLDGKPDLAVANQDSDNVTILLDDRNGGFTQPAGSPLGVGSNPGCVAIGDFNIDGKPDLAVVNITSANVTIQLNTCDAFPCGGIGFTQRDGSPFGAGSQPVSLAVGDFNLDGKPDLAVANRSPGQVTILLGNGSGGFTQATGSPVAGGPIPRAVAVGDFNQDGKPDLAVANFIFSGTVTILLGNGNGGFTEATGSPVGAGINPASVAIGDFNLDGKTDLVVANGGSNNVTILFGNGAGGFTQASGSPFGAGTSPASVAVGDFNLDGKPDLAVANAGFDDNVTILLGDGSGGFTQPVGSPVGAGTSPRSVAIGDFNLDGKVDLAVANANSDDVTILLGNGSGGFTEATGSPVGAGSFPQSVVVEDFNQDGKPDLAVADENSNSITILLGDGSGGFTEPDSSPIVVGSAPLAVAAGDFNLDGELDLAVTIAGSGDVTILLNTCSGCTITCPANQFAATGLGATMCCAVVTFPDPTTSGTCGTVTCSPASGSCFPVGATTVTCSEPGGPSCSFTVTVTDNTPPMITCPGNVSVAAAASCPFATSAPVSFSVNATDNCTLQSVSCSPPSGSNFPVGTTTVVCKATDVSGNMATCTLAVSVFSFCLQDDSNFGNAVLVNAQTGDFSFCCGGVPIASGRGTLVTRGCSGSIDGTKGDRKVHIQWDASSNNGNGSGTASIQKLSNKVVCQITDKNMSNNTCQCSNAPPPAGSRDRQMGRNSGSVSV